MVFQSAAVIDELSHCYFFYLMTKVIRAGMAFSVILDIKRLIVRKVTYKPMIKIQYDETSKILFNKSLTRGED